MRALLFISLITSFKLHAQVSRSPAIVSGKCDLNIPTIIKQAGTEKLFSRTITQQVAIDSEDGVGCSALPKNRYPDSVYIDRAQKMMSEAFAHSLDNYQVQCSTYFKFVKSLADNQFTCGIPEIVTIKLNGFGCEKKISTDSQKEVYTAFTYADITYKEVGQIVTERPIEVVQKEQCKKVNECMNEAEESEMANLKKLAAVACKGDITPVATANSPKMESDNSFDGRRKAKAETEDTKVHTPEESGSIGR